MKNKLTTYFAIFFLVIGLLFLCSNFIDFNKKISFYDYDSKNIFPDSTKLNKNIIIFKSNTDISKYKIKTSCNNKFKYLWEKNDLYIFTFKLLDNNCENPVFILSDWKESFEKTKFELNIENKYNIYSQLIDYSDKNLSKLLEKTKIEKNNYSKYKKIFNKSLFNIKKNRLYSEINYKLDILKEIIERRKLKYDNPVPWYKITTKLNQIPNAGRPYRDNYTDWIHHWWDIMAPEGTPVSAIDDWIIIRTVENFDFEDIDSNIIKEWEVDKTQKLRNLDILRWQQVWLKTTKWDVMFYSHLSKIYDNIEEWTFVKSWEKIWEIWKTWVPDKDYQNIHLHFPIMKNPYNKDKINNYSYEDIMAWDWYLKGLNPDVVLKEQKNIFVNNAF